MDGMTTHPYRKQSVKTNSSISCPTAVLYAWTLLLLSQAGQAEGSHRRLRRPDPPGDDQERQDRRPAGRLLPQGGPLTFSLSSRLRLRLRLRFTKWDAYPPLPATRIVPVFRAPFFRDVSLVFSYVCMVLLPCMLLCKASPPVVRGTHG